MKRVNMGVLWPTLDPEIKSLLAKTDRLFNPTRDMTALEAHIFTNECVYAEHYADQIDEECEDPAERLEREEEELVRLTGRNYSGRIIYQSTGSFDKE